jgi:site-specific DNA recombinase
MKIADLYIRVSTDEQAEKGYSQRGQEEMLRKYCGINQISIRKVIYEDHSAKTFERPAWTALLSNLKKQKGKVDLVIFTKWDRFSRNAGDAYHMIGILRKLGVEPQAIEQPLDLSVPENKMMLAFYLAAPEVENDRRALNTIYGMRRAQKEGRYMGVAPIGYINRITDSGKKYIAIDQSKANLLRQAFEEMATGIYNMEDVRKRAVRKGLRCPKTTFRRALENPVYCGKIELKAYRDEKAELIDGQHEALISEKLFYDIQDAIDGKRKRHRPNVKEISNAAFELRGFLKCQKCGKVLTASTSKGRNARYSYYHCNSSCGVRYSAPEANEAFVRELQKFTPEKATEELFRELVVEEFSDQIRNQQKEKKKVLQDIQKQNERLEKARELLLSSVLDAKDYKVIKNEAEEQLLRLEARLVEATNQNQNTLNLESKVERAISILLNLPEIYQKADINTKREILGSIFPEKLEFSENNYRTGKINEVASLMYHINSTLYKEKTGTSDDDSSKFRLVPRAGVEPAHLAILVFETNASTNSAIWACPLMGVQK